MEWGGVLWVNVSASLQIWGVVAAHDSQEAHTNVWNGARAR